VARYALPLKLNIVVAIAWRCCLLLAGGPAAAAAESRHDGRHRPLDAVRDRRPGRRHGADALLLLHPRPALDAAGLGHRALHYAPVAALAGVVVPEVVMSNGHLVATWQDARLFARRSAARSTSGAAACC
jgi:hypothetical protein